MDSPQLDRAAFEEMAQCLRTRNQRYLDFLKESGDLADKRSKVLAKIFDCAADGIIVLDKDLTIVMANLSAANLAGLEIEDMSRNELRRQYKFYLDEGKTPLPYDDEPIVVAIRERRGCELVAFAVSEHLSAPGRWVRVHAAPIFDEQNEVLGGISVFTDLTDRLKLQKQRDCLAALITHDIKNHFIAEQLFLQELSDEGNLDSKNLKTAGELNAASEKFMRVADSLLEMFGAHLVVDHIPKPILLTPVLAKAVELSALEAKSRKVKIELQSTSESVMVLGSADVLCHVFHNLVQNAVNASPPQSTVFIKTSVTSHFAAVQVRDSGVGMTEGEVSALFSPPNIAIKKSKLLTSSGFGLYLSHMLIDGQGGSINCSSEPGRGTALTVLLPAK